MILSPQPGAHLASVAAAQALRALFPTEDPVYIRNLVERSGVDTRHNVPSLGDVLARKGFTERNLVYREAALALAERSARTALERARIDASEIDALIDVSCTGISIPALDVGLAPRLGLRKDVRRIPITESGCAAGGLALGIAGAFAQAGQ